jgi:wobble nucleotide-excising tRNase
VRKQDNLLGAPNNADWEGKYDVEKIRFSGFIAQEVESSAKKIGYNFSGVDKSGSLYGLRYAEFVVPIVKSVQELDNENKALKLKVDSLEKELSKQQKEFELLLKRIEQLESVK